MHCYLIVPDDAEDETSNSINLVLMKKELVKPDPSNESLKLLMSHMFPIHRPFVLESDSVQSIIEEYPLLKRSVYEGVYFSILITIFVCCFKGELELGLVMQRLEMKEGFDEETISWAHVLGLLPSKQSLILLISS